MAWSECLGTEIDETAITTHWIGEGFKTEGDALLQLEMVAGVNNYAASLGLRKGTFQAVQSKENQAVWNGTVHWVVGGLSRLKPKIAGIGSLVVEFSCMGTTQKRYTAIQTLEVKGGDAIGGGPTIDDVNNLINCDENSVQGCDVYVPQQKMTIRTSYPSLGITFAYYNALQSIQCTVNQSPFLLFPKGSVLFLGWSLLQRYASQNEDTEISYEFLIGTPGKNIDVGGGIVWPNIEGWQFHWERTSTQLVASSSGEPGTGTLSQQTLFSVLQQVYNYGDFSVISLPPVS